MKPLVLASASPRRKVLLELLDIPFSIAVADTEEYIDPTLPLAQAIEQVAYQKATAVYANHMDSIILAADTIVCIDDTILGKPHTDDKALEMLEMLSGKTHQVITGVAILHDENVDCFHEVSEVTFYPLTKQEIKNYIETKEPLDKAGAYGIQGKGAILVAKICGDYYNIVGLPLARVYRHLRKIL